MKFAKKLDKILKQHLDKDFRKDTQNYQDLFAKISKIAFQEYELIPWVPVANGHPDHKLDVLIWVEPKENNPASGSMWKTGWYDWKHDAWIYYDGFDTIPVDLLWKVTHWASVETPWAAQ